MATVLGIPRKVTFRDLQRWPDDGRRYELYDGEVVVVPAPFPRHQIALLELEDHLRHYVRQHGGIVLVAPIDIVFNQTNVLQPDIVIFGVARRHHVKLDNAIRVPPDVAVEVLSEGTASNDRGRKLKAFERFGVAEYWIVDPVKELVEVRRLGQHHYEAAATARRGDNFESVILPGFTCEVATLFPW